MKRIIITFLTLAVNLTTYSQNDCNCEKVMEQIIYKIENEYPGFQEKTTNGILYNSFKNKMVSKSKKSQDSVCLNTLREYLSFFQDGHIYLYRDEIEQKEKDIISNDKLNVDIKQFIIDIQNTSDKLEGIWESPNYKIGIIKSKENDYQGFIIEADTTYWKPNEIKFKLYNENNADYFMQNHSLQKETYKIYDNSILYFKDLQSVFIKKKPTPEINTKQIEKKINEIEGFYFKELTSKTVYFKIASFNYPYVDRIEKLIDDNKSFLENHENLIIDLRDNRGGTDLAYQKLLPYIYTNPIRSVGVEYLATQTLINGLQNYLKKISDDEKYESDRKRINKNIKLYKENLGKFVNPDSTIIYIDTIEVAKHSPSQVVILSNNRVGSSAENFIMHVKQSKKVKILGTPSYGALDYGSARWFEIGCKNYHLSLPTFRSLRLPDFPIDNIGLQPDIYIDKSVTNWIDFALKYLEN